MSYSQQSSLSFRGHYTGIKKKSIHKTALIDGFVSVSSQTVVMSSVQQVWTSSNGNVRRMTYGNNEDMSAIIAPARAATVRLQFISFSTEPGFDFVTVNSCTAIDCSQTSQLGKFSGTTTIPGPVTSNTGIMQIRWTSDASAPYPGWSASWSSTTDNGMQRCITILCTPEASVSGKMRSC
jgi:hypothetical protein